MLIVANKHIMLSVIMQNVVMLSVVMQNVVMLSVVLLNVVAPARHHHSNLLFYETTKIATIYCL